MEQQVTFEEFANEWLQDVKAEPNSLAVGRSFARKLISNWLDFSGDSTYDDVFYCDGSGDGGIDIAYLQRGDNDPDSDDFGDTWYVVQSKYGTAYNGKETVLLEAQKAIDTLRGKYSGTLNPQSEDVVNRISAFRDKASPADRLIFVIATNDELSTDEHRALEDVRRIGRAEFGDLFGVETVSIRTIFDRALDAQSKKFEVEMVAQLVPSGNDLLVGSISLISLYNFLKEYRNQTRDLDQIYERNVRKYLGRGRKVNKKIRETIETEPELFGLYNNGITIVTQKSRIADPEAHKYFLTEPYIVNGCQTTRSIWDVLDPKLSSGGTGIAEESDWYQKLSAGIVVVKIVQVPEDDNELLDNTTRYTNSQTAVTPKDFLALERSFRQWQESFANQHDIFLEIQRGGWDAQKAYQKANPNSKYYKKWTSAFDLLKIFGAGWLQNPGLAFGKNPPFAPGGAVFRKLTAAEYGLNLDDLYAAFLLNELQSEIGFGRDAKKPSRGQAKYLFCYIFINFVKYCIGADDETTHNAISNAVIQILTSSDKTARDEIVESALATLDDYLSMASEDSVKNEATFQGDLNAYLKNEKLGTSDFSPKLSQLLRDGKRDLRRHSVVDLVEELIAPAQNLNP